MKRRDRQWLMADPLDGAPLAADISWRPFDVR